MFGTILAIAALAIVIYIAVDEARSARTQQS